MRHHRSLRIPAALTLTAALFVGACGNDDSASSQPTSVASRGKGWISGEPDWTNASGAAGGGRATPMMVESAAASTTAAGSAASTSAKDVGAVPAPVADHRPLKAGSKDDNADYAAYLAYLDRVEAAGITGRPFDARGRIVVTVTGSDGLPVPGAEVAVTAAGKPVATVRTTANGTARFLPGLYGEVQAGYDFAVAGATASAAPGTDVAVQLGTGGGRSAPLKVEVQFLLDATGSMGDEIDRLRDTITSVSERIAGLDGTPQVRFGMTLYRDVADSFVATTFDLTDDLGAFKAALADVTADGGGDYPEALDEGLNAALVQPTWGDPATTLQLMFLVADAPPQVLREVPQGYPQSVIDAVQRGIKIFPVASSETDDQAELVFRQIAAATGARFVFMSYGAGGAATGEQTDIGPTDYEELSLDDLVVRLVAEELAAVNATEVVVAPTTTVPPTNPPGQ